MVWQIVAAEKTRSKDRTVSDSHSQWQVTWEDAESKRQEKMTYEIESAPRNPSNPINSSTAHRRERYAACALLHRVGTSGVVKDLIPQNPSRTQALNLPSILLKSFHYDSKEAESCSTPRGREAYAAVMDKTTQFYREAQGLIAFSGKRERSSLEVELPFLIMQKLGDNDLLTSYEKFYGEAQSLSPKTFARTPFEDIATIFVKLLAQLQYLYHLNQGQGLFDIKAENMVGVFDKEKRVKDIHLIDIEGAFTKAISLTPGVLTESDKAILLHHLQHKTRPSPEDSQAIDRRLLAHAALVTLYLYNYPTSITTWKEGRDKTFKISNQLAWSTLDEGDPIRKFYTDFCSGAILKKDPYQSIYAEELARLKQDSPESLETKPQAPQRNQACRFLSPPRKKGPDTDSSISLTPSSSRCAT